MLPGRLHAMASRTLDSSALGQSGPYGMESAEGVRGAIDHRLPESHEGYQEVGIVHWNAEIDTGLSVWTHEMQKGGNLAVGAWGGNEPYGGIPP